MRAGDFRCSESVSLFHLVSPFHWLVRGLDGCFGLVLLWGVCCCLLFVVGSWPFLLMGREVGLFLVVWEVLVFIRVWLVRGSCVSSSWMRFLLPPNNLWLIVLRRSHRVSDEWFSAMMLDGCHLMKLVRFVHMISLKITFLAIQLSWLLSSPALAAFEELLLTTKMSLFALKLFLPVIMRLTHLALPWKSWANLALTVNISRLSTFLLTFPKMFFENMAPLLIDLSFKALSLEKPNCSGLSLLILLMRSYFPNMY